MTCEIKYGKTIFNIFINNKGGKVIILKNKNKYWSGQWFPEEKILFLKNFPFENIRKHLEIQISNQIKSNQIIFPYIPEML